MTAAAAPQRLGAVRTGQIACDVPDSIEDLARQLGPDPLALVCLFISPNADFADLCARAAGAFGAVDVLACTTAGEIGAAGYEEDQIIAVGFPEAWFTTSSYVIEKLSDLNDEDVVDQLILHRTELTRRAPHRTSEFAMLMVDGLSLREEHLTALLARGLGPMPLFGGSSGDGARFRQTYLSRNGVVRDNAAIIALVRSDCPVRVFSLDHLTPSDTRMVVTSADPEARIVREINAEPAAQEYARLLGKDPNQLDPFTFAAHPVVVRLGDSHHVRAIQRVTDAGELIFFSAINEGMVLTLAERGDMAGHLQRGLDALAEGGAPDHILGCDCILRRIEAGQSQLTRRLSDILVQHKVTGFSTYGEQIGALHVNQTLTGVAIYPPPGREES